MIKSIKFNKKIILIIIILLVVICYIYFKNNNNYEEITKIEDFSTDEEAVNLNGEEEVTKKSQENRVTNELEKDNDSSEVKIDSKEIIIVHITGEVNNWGVIELEKGSRIIDAVDKAGGFTEEADTTKVNLAYELSDGVKIYIPSKTDESIIQDTKYITENSGDNVSTEVIEMKEKENALVNINKATQTELETLPGIGPSIALKIISYREEKGDFSSIEDIKNVSGIGENKFENIKELICI